MNHGELTIISGTAGKHLTKGICRLLSLEEHPVEIKKFSDDEIRPRLFKSVRDKDVFINNPAQQPAENWDELKLLSQVVWNASAERITLVIPYLGYDRQDKKDKSRTSITIAKKIEDICGYNDRVLLLDIHSEPTLGYFDILRVRQDHLYASYVLAPYINDEIIKGRRDKFVFVSPDPGGIKRAKKYSIWFGCDLAICYKVRIEANKVEKIILIGDVEGKYAVVVDDMFDTCGTLEAVSNKLIEEGALGVYAVGTHPVLSDDALEIISRCSIEEIAFTNSIYHSPKKLNRVNVKITVIPIDEMMSRAVTLINQGESLDDELFLPDDEPIYVS